MAHVPVIPPGSTPPPAPYSPGVRVASAGQVVDVSGMLALDGTGAFVGVGDVRVQHAEVAATACVCA
ncbi:MAG: hypothetical protein WCS09_04240 [Pseudomonadota bacterium]